MDLDKLLDYLAMRDPPRRREAGERCLACKATPATHPAPDGRPGLLCDDCDSRRARRLHECPNS